MSDRDVDIASFEGNTESALPSAGHSQPRRACDEIYPNDTTSILHGAQSFTGKAVFSAGRMTVEDNPIARYIKAQEEKEREDAAELLEMEHLALWNTQMTFVGGVSMTNEEAQTARREVDAHADRYADWARDHGYIREDEREDFKRGIRRKIELEDKRGRGINTADDDRENAALDASRAGHAVDAATAEYATQNGFGHAAGMNRNDANAALASNKGAASANSASFQANRDDVTQPPQFDQRRSSIAPRIAATGLNL